MKHKAHCLLVGIATISASIIVFAEEYILNAENFSANVSFTTNYIFRGETQTNDNPAIQGGLDWNYDSFYLGVWGSNVDFQSGDSVEIDYYGGIAGEINSFAYDLGLFYYTYPGANDDGFEFDYFEFIPSISYTFDTPYEPSVYAHLGYSPEYFGEEGTGIDIEAGLSFTFDKFGIDAAIGNQWVDGDTSNADIEWLYYNMGVTTSAIGFDLDLRFHAARENGIDWLANDEFPNDEFVTFSINRSF
jgi:uncharacterized protein (TIGR02001 family)